MTVVYIADARPKVCNKCGLTKPMDKFPLRKSEFTGQSYRNPICRACRNIAASKWHKNNPQKAKISAKRADKKRNKTRSDRPVYHYREKFGLTIPQKWEMLVAQYGECAICGTINVTHKKGWCVDHDHKTGDIRSILCTSCNATIGHAKDDPTILHKAAKYLEHHMTKFSWSYSKLKNFETCPRRHQELDIKKAWPEEPSEQLVYGDAVHKAMAKALRNKQELPAAYQAFQPWVDKILRIPGELLVESECKWAVTEDLQPTAWFSEKAWLRSIADAVVLDGDIALVVDFKSGKSANQDPVQLMLISLIMFIHFSRLQCIRADFIWLQEDSQTTQVLYRNECADQWAGIMPRIKRLQQATIDGIFPPTPNRFCKKWCPVKSCEYWGK